MLDFTHLVSPSHVSGKSLEHYPILGFAEQPWKSFNHLSYKAASKRTANIGYAYVQSGTEALLVMRLTTVCLCRSATSREMNQYVAVLLPNPCFSPSPALCLSLPPFLSPLAPRPVSGGGGGEGWGQGGRDGRTDGRADGRSSAQRCHWNSCWPMLLQCWCVAQSCTTLLQSFHKVTQWPVNMIDF